MITRKAAIPPFLALALLVWGAFALTPLLVVLFMLLGDIDTFALSKDNVVPSSRPDRWVVRSLRRVSTFGRQISQSITVSSCWPPCPLRLPSGAR